jgi:glycosyltransferase involved in cell wall biosynthesis
MKKILLVSQNFYPENFKSNDIAFGLKKNGYDVTVLTGIPHYPMGSFFSGYGVFRKRIEIIDGVKIYRCLQIPRGRRFVRYLLPFTYLSFMVFGSFLAIYLAFSKKFDFVLVHQVSPITQALPAILVKRIQNIPMVLWVLDLWPDAFISGSGIKNPLVINLISRFVRFTYLNSDKILIGSKYFSESIKMRMTKSVSIEYFPNWAEDVFHSISMKHIPLLPQGFIITMAGNLGISQNLENIMEVANQLRHTNVKWVFIGDGSKKDWLVDYVKNNKLEQSVFILGPYPIEFMPVFYKQSDIMLLSLNNRYSDLEKVVPARLQSYMAAGKPVIGFIQGAAADVILESKCGFVINPDNISGLKDLIIHEILPNTGMLVELGISGYNYYQSCFSRKKCLSHLINILNETTLHK